MENLLLGAPGGSPSGDNSVCHLSEYRSAIVAAVPGLRELDSEEVAGASGERAGEGPGAPAQRVSPPPVVLLQALSYATASCRRENPAPLLWITRLRASWP